MDSSFGMVYDHRSDYAELTAKKAILKAALDTEILRTHLFSDLRLRYDRTNLLAGAGLLWLPQLLVARPAGEAEIIHRLDGGSSFAFRTGISPGYIDEYVYMRRRLNEEMLDMEATTDLRTPPMAISTALVGEWAFTPEQSLTLSPHFNWYYDLSGISLETAYAKSGQSELFERGVYMEPDHGFSTGVNLGWGLDTESLDLEIAYALSLTKYHAQDQGRWVFSNNDVRHVVDLKLAWKPVPRVALGMTGAIYVDKPFTPEKVERSVDSGTGEIIYEVVSEDFNSARDILPRYRLGLSARWGFKLFKRYESSLFINAYNLVDILNPALVGLKEELLKVDGASTKDFGNREYALRGSSMIVSDLFKTQLGLSITF